MLEGWASSCRLVETSKVLVMNLNLRSSGLFSCSDWAQHWFIIIVRGVNSSARFYKGNDLGLSTPVQMATVLFMCSLTKP